MLSIEGRHDDQVLQEENFIVEKCSMHHGSKDKNPLSKMRFLPKNSLHKLMAANINDLPEAVVADESTYKAVLPQLLQENSIRVYSRLSSKCDLVSHVFSAWLDHIKTQQCCGFDAAMTPLQPQAAAMLTQETPASSIRSEDGGAAASVGGGRLSWSVVSPPLKRPRTSDGDC